MLEKPDLEDVKIIECLREEYGLSIVEVIFLPLGADRNTAVYRVVTDQAVPYFVKLRREVFDEIAVLVPKHLHDQGITQVIAPISTLLGSLWASLGEFTLTVSPFIEGHNGFEVDLSDRHWVEFGRALKRIHTAVLPQELLNRLPRETFSSYWRELVRRFQKQIEDTVFEEPVAAKMAAFLRSRQDVMSWLVMRAEQLAAVLQTQPLDMILCHADIHVGNLLMTASGDLYVVDWDTLTLAPKERDLMFIGGGIGRAEHPAEEALFYQGYGQTDVNPILIVYYRYERIVQDIAAYCEQILLTDEGGEDREEGFRQLRSQFLPKAVIEIAYQSEKNLPQALQSQDTPQSFR